MKYLKKDLTNVYSGHIVWQKTSTQQKYSEYKEHNANVQHSDAGDDLCVKHTATCWAAGMMPVFTSGRSVKRMVRIAAFRAVRTQSALAFSGSNFPAMALALDGHRRMNASYSMHSEIFSAHYLFSIKYARKLACNLQRIHRTIYYIISIEFKSSATLYCAIKLFITCSLFVVSVLSSNRWKCYYADSRVLYHKMDANHMKNNPTL